MLACYKLICLWNKKEASSFFKKGKRSIHKSLNVRFEFILPEVIEIIKYILIFQLTQIKV